MARKGMSAGKLNYFIIKHPFRDELSRPEFVTVPLEKKTYTIICFALKLMDTSAVY